MERINGTFFSIAFRKAAERLLKNKDELNTLNVFPVPDGDTGSNMSAAMIEACAYLDSAKDKDLDTVLGSIKTGMLMGARGNSGVILSQIFRGFADGTGTKKELTTTEFTNALSMAKTVAYKSVMKPIEGTMLTLIRKLAEFTKEELKDEKNFKRYFDLMTQKAFDVVEKTPKYLKKLQEAGVVDSGAKGLAYIFEGFKLAALGSTETDIDITKGFSTSKSLVETVVQGVMEELEFSYCTEVIINQNDDKNDFNRDGIKSYLESMGDSIVLVKQDKLIKVHVHTNHPGKVIEKLLDYGEMQKVKVDNMKIQHKHVVEAREVKEDVYAADKKHGILCVSPGEGLSKIMLNLGADKIITGGQTMNPSLKDIYNSLKKFKSEDIILFPNNPNIILTAKEAAKEYEKENTEKKVYVFETNSSQECIAALTQYDDIQTFEKLKEEMDEAIENVVSLSVTYAVRDSKIQNIKVKKNEYLGIYGEKMVLSNKKLDKLINDAIDDILKKDKEKEVITIFYGSEVSENQAKKLMQQLEENYSDIEFELHEGGQPYYYYLISIE